MSRPRSRKPSRWGLTLRLRWRRSWTSWRLARSAKKRAREEKRLQLLLMSLDSSQLRIKELELREAMLAHRMTEMAESRQHRTAGVLPPATPSTPDLDQALGISTPTL